MARSVIGSKHLSFADFFDMAFLLTVDLENIIVIYPFQFLRVPTVLHHVISWLKPIIRLRKDWWYISIVCKKLASKEILKMWYVRILNTILQIHLQKSRRQPRFLEQILRKSKLAWSSNWATFKKNDPIKSVPKKRKCKSLWFSWRWQ